MWFFQATQAEWVALALLLWWGGCPPPAAAAAAPALAAPVFAVVSAAAGALLLLLGFAAAQLLEEGWGRGRELLCVLSQQEGEGGWLRTLGRLAPCV